MTYNSLVTNGVLPPLLMSIFGIWTVKNVRHVGATRRTSESTITRTTAVGRSNALRSKDQQLIRMLLVDILTFVIFKSPVTIMFIYQEATKYQYKSVEQQIAEQMILQITYFVFFIENSLSCYTNILVSKTFRSELRRVILNVRHFRLCQWVGF
mgnify:CR=1 FL=1